ncbi:PDDEXK nuclease domain-containing protein [Arabiibacter massiliensis]|uniref:PDDEXK nuclease domain-containing protein n=1 Tax=Arabiibacter massiliensis TaxID=1870985 RepID=UPI0009BBA501|nr:PDDEXK nuclease domain-containing protein [Arabiibacter massiliensis]
MGAEANLDRFYDDVADLLARARERARAAVNVSMVYTYFEIGRMIIEEEQHGEGRAAYGKRVLEGLSKRLTKEFGRGFSVPNLKLIRQFYQVYSKDQIGETLFSQFGNLPLSSTGRVFRLSWSHYLKLMRIGDLNERHFYEVEAARNNWSLAELGRQLDSALYERFALSRGEGGIPELAKGEPSVRTARDLVKDPFVLEFLGFPEHASYSEKELEARIIDNLQAFLLEMGTGFAFVGRQVRITLENDHFWVDLVFFNRILRCFVLVDLKIGRLTHQDIGQMQMYVNYYDRRVKLAEEGPTVGIVLCKEKNQSVVRMTLPEDNEQVFASRYQTVLPSREELVRLLEEGVEADGSGSEAGPSAS